MLKKQINDYLLNKNYMGSVTCQCIEFTPYCDTFADYVDCNGNLITIEVFSGQTYTLCSLDGFLDISCGRFPINITNYGPCATSTPCIQLTTTTTYFPITTTTTTFNPNPLFPVEPTNECDVITIFPMGVECQSINPSFTNTFDGTASLKITGGTPPYEILWNNGSVGPTISNLSVGEYSATVTDSYGDFLITTTCVLTAETPSVTTTTTSTTPTPTYPDLCMILTDNSSREQSVIQIDFTYNSIINEKPSWISSTNDNLIYWNTGTTQEWILSGTTSFTVYNPNPATPPLVGWVILGTKGSVYVTEGNCSSIQNLFININKNEPTCTNDGSIIVQANGGIPPYEYSKNGGVSYQTNPIFNNLSGGNYLVKVKDSIGVFQTQLVILTPIITTTTVYTLTLNKTSSTFAINVSPSLPIGVTINFDLVFDSTFTVTPSQLSATYNGNLNVLVNSNPVLPGSPVVTNTTSFNPCNGGSFYTTNNKLVWPISITNLTTINGTITDQIIPLLPQPTCYSASRSYTISLDNVSIIGCTCCSVTTQQTSAFSLEGPSI